MAERLKTHIKEKNHLVDIIAGPDSYRDLPNLINQLGESEYQMNVQLSMEETYEGITPVRVDKSSKTAFVSIMRGCNNMYESGILGGL